MNRLHPCLISLGLFFANCCFLQVQAEEPGIELRLLSYNIHHGRGLDDRVDLPRIAKVVSDCSPDLVALQEVDVKTKRTGHVDQVAELAGLTGLHARFLKQIDYEGGEYGQAILSRWPISEPEILWLPGEPNREQRILGVVRTTGEDAPKIAFASTHLHHNNAKIRLQQAQAIRKFLQEANSKAASLQQYKRPFLIAGDFNAEPQSEVMQLLSMDCNIFGFNQPAIPTFPSDQPTKQIDYIVAYPSQSVQVMSVAIAEHTQASDHLPLLALVRLQSE